MPLDGHAYLVAQGWSGKGSGLREGAISRPLAVAQKKTLSGLGKDRDEAFPFWDHLFSAASTSIKIKIALSDDESSDEINETTTATLDLKRTGTGILCNRRPILGTLASSSSSSSGTTTPSINATASRSVSLLTSAKREAAKRNLYSRFFRGPVLGPDDDTATLNEDKFSESADSIPQNLDMGSTDTGPSRKRECMEDEDVPTRTKPRSNKSVGKSRSSSSTSAEVDSYSEAEDEGSRKLAKAARKQARAERRRLREEKRLAKARRREEEVERAETKAREIRTDGTKKDTKKKRRQDDARDLSADPLTVQVDQSNDSAVQLKMKRKKRKRDEE